MNFLRRCGAMGLLVLACAGTQKKAESPAPQPSPRLKDSAPERAAAQRAAAGLQLEADDERFGVEAARERKRAQEESRAAAKPPAGPAAGKGVQVVPPPNANPR